MSDSNFSDWSVVTGDGLDDFREIVYEKRHHRTLGGGVARHDEQAGQDERDDARDG